MSYKGIVMMTHDDSKKIKTHLPLQKTRIQESKLPAATHALRVPASEQVLYR
jgi:hypothetical protein